LIAFGAFYGGHVFNVDNRALYPALIAVIAIGFISLLFGVWHAPVFLIQVCGLATYAKVARLTST